MGVYRGCWRCCGTPNGVCPVAPDGQGRVFISYGLHPIAIFVQRIKILQMEKIDAVETISLKFKFAIVALVALSGVLAYLIFGNDY